MIGKGESFALTVRGLCENGGSAALPSGKAPQNPSRAFGARSRSRHFLLSARIGERMSKIKRFFRQTGLTKAQLLASLLCYFLCFALFLGIVVIWNPMSNPTNDQTTVVEAATGPTNSGYWTDSSSRYDISWYNNPDTETYGDGTESNPYKISTAAQLAGLSWLVYNKTVDSEDVTTRDDKNYIFQGKFFKQTENIDLSAYYWQPIGIYDTREGTTRRNYFSGSYDGGNHTVSGIFTPAGSSYPYSYQGLFGYVGYSSSSNPVTIQNIGINNSFIQGSEYVGGVVGNAYGSSGTITITNCYNTGAVSGKTWVGGVVGYAAVYSGTITITNCYNTGAVTSTATSNARVGGVVGYAGQKTTITNCYNTGAVTGAGSYVGGVVGYAYAYSFGTTTITNCYNTGAVTGSGSYVDGVVGNTYVTSSGNPTVTNCYYGGRVTETM